MALNLRINPEIEYIINQTTKHKPIKPKTYPGLPNSLSNKTMGDPGEGVLINRKLIWSIPKVNARD